MPLKAVVETLDEVPDGLKEFYEEAEGGFRLSVEGMKSESDIAGLSSALEKERKARRTMEKQMKGFPENFDPDDYAAMLKEREEREARSHEQRTEEDKKIARVREEEARKTKAAEDRASVLESQLDKTLRENEAVKALDDAEAFTSVALPHVLGKTETRESDGQRRVVVLDDEGDPRYNGDGSYMTIRDLVKEMKGQQEWGPLFKAKEAVGGGATGRGGARGAKGKAFKDMSERERMDFMDALVEEHGPAKGKELYYQSVRGLAVA